MGDGKRSVRWQGWGISGDAVNGVGIEDENKKKQLFLSSSFGIGPKILGGHLFIVTSHPYKFHPPTAVSRRDGSLVRGNPEVFSHLL